MPGIIMYENAEKPFESLIKEMSVKYGMIIFFLILIKIREIKNLA